MTARSPIIDISPALTPNIAVWPGDTPLSREVLCTIEGGASVTLSTLRATVHLGAHADGVNHYGGGAAGIEAFPLERYLGACHVVRARAERRAGGMRVGAADLDCDLAAIRHPRVLIHTDTFPDFTNWNTNFAGLTPRSSMRSPTAASRSSASTRRASMCRNRRISPRTSGFSRAACRSSKACGSRVSRPASTS